MHTHSRPQISSKAIRPEHTGQRGHESVQTAAADNENLRLRRIAWDKSHVVHFLDLRRAHLTGQ